MSIRQIETAIPHLVSQDELNQSYVLRWKRQAESALQYDRAELVKSLSPLGDLFHYRESGVSGVWFVVSPAGEVAYLYAYQGVKVSGTRCAAEALAYLFDPHVRGLTKEIFFEHLLPYSKFVVTDSVYTPDGLRWFEAEYVHAFRLGYDVFAIDLSTRPHSAHRITREQFDLLKPLYWGQAAQHQKYRFAIQQK